MTFQGISSHLVDEEVRWQGFVLFVWDMLVTLPISQQASI